MTKNKPRRRARRGRAPDTALVALIAWSFAGCASVPKPQELVSFERLRKAPNFKRVQKRQAALVAKSNDDYSKALEHWQDDEVDMAKHWAIVGQIKLRTAMALHRQRALMGKLASAKKRLKALRAKAGAVTAKVHEADEKIKLYEQLAVARSAAKEKDLALSTAEKRVEAQKVIAAAQMAVKLAEAVHAAQHASKPFRAAQDLLASATVALQAGDPIKASASAGLAKAKADAAYNAAKAAFNKEKAAASRKLRNQALQRDAAGIAGVTAKLKASGQTQKLILPVIYLFAGRKTAPRASKVAVLDAIGALLKKYPDYPVIINGFTSHRVRRSQRYAVSQTRAQQVANHFVNMGLSLKRFAIAGHGAEELIDRRWSRNNDRVEIIFLFQ